MNELLGLGYVGVSTEDLSEWRVFAEEVLAAQVETVSAEHIALRFDERARRAVIEKGQNAGQYYGFEVPDAAALQSVAGRVDAAGHAVRRATAIECELRAVEAAIS